MPYPFTPSNFFSAFAQIGGVGCTLGLIIAVLIISNRKRSKIIASWSTFSTIFNANLPLALGLPVILNPILFLPFIFIPIINMILGSIAIAAGLFPPLVFPVPIGTPGVLIPLVASGGNSVALIMMLILLVIDVLVYLPFVKFANSIEEAVYMEQTNEEKK